MISKNSYLLNMRGVLLLLFMNGNLIMSQNNVSLFDYFDYYSIEIAVMPEKEQNDFQVTNICPSNTVNLTTAVDASNTPPDAILSWHTALPTTSANKVETPTAVGEGTYYATFYDTINECYGDNISAVQVNVIITTCPEICNNNIDDDNNGQTDCEDITCNCDCPNQITGTLTPSIYNDQNTPQDITDDTYSFQLTVNGQGNSGWIGEGKTGSFGVLTNFGPYPVGTAASFRIYDATNSSCFFSVSANMNVCTYLETCTCCKSNE